MALYMHSKEVTVFQNSMTFPNMESKSKFHVISRVSQTLNLRFPPKSNSLTATSEMACQLMNLLNKGQCHYPVEIVSNTSHLHANRHFRLMKFRAQSLVVAT